MAPRDGSPWESILNVTATTAPLSPAAYCRTAPVPLRGGGPGLYVDFSMFCFQVPMSGLAVGGVEICARFVELTIIPMTQRTNKLRFIRPPEKGSNSSYGSVDCVCDGYCLSTP